MESADHITARRAPVQARSKGREEALLLATWAVLAERGLEGLTTKHVAEAAGVPIGSVYYLFPNKHALLARLMESVTVRIEDTCRRHLDYPKKPWQEHLGELVDDLAEEWARDRGFAVLWAGARHVPELRPLDGECTARIAKVYKAFLKRVCPKAKKGDVDTASRVLAHVIDRLLTESLEEKTPKKRRRMVAHLKGMLVGYVEGFWGR